MQPYPPILFELSLACSFIIKSYKNMKSVKSQYHFVNLNHRHHLVLSCNYVLFIVFSFNFLKKKYGSLMHDTIEIWDFIY